MRNLIDIVSEDYSTNVSTAAREWGKKAEPKDTPESAALQKLKDAHREYMDVLRASKSPTAPQYLKMLKKVQEVLHWMG